MKKLILPVALLLAAAGLAGCGSGSSAPPETPVTPAVGILGADLLAPDATSELSGELIPDNTATSVPGKDLLPPV